MTTVAAPQPAVSFVPGGTPKTGWNLVQFLDGTIGVAKWTGQAFQWGSLASQVPGDATIGSVTFLGTDLNTLNTGALAKLPNKIALGITDALDRGQLSGNAQGVPAVAFNGNTGAPIGDSGKVGSEANPQGISAPSISLPSLPGSGILDALGSTSFWKGLGLVIGGALILIFAAIELTGVGSGGGGKVIPIPL